MNETKTEADSPVTVQIVSDIHPEYTNDSSPDILDFVTPSADILVLAGDCGNLHKPTQLEHLLLSACIQFKYVIYVPGNHEFYRFKYINSSPMETLQVRLENIERSVNGRLHGNVKRLHVLQRGMIRVGGALFIGCTLWSRAIFEGGLPTHIVRIGTRSNSGVTSLTKEGYNRLHEIDLDFITETVNEATEDDSVEKVIVITHHPPCRDMFFPHELTTKYSTLYYTDLPRELFEKVDMWISGHIHKTYDIAMPEGCRLVSNQIGKPNRPNLEFSREFIVDI